MQRYLLRFSYFGTNFNGLQVQSRTKNDYKTIQGVLEAGLRFLRPANEPLAHISSRTDSGVHALDNCLHVELLPRPGCSPYAPSYITNHLNKFLALAGVKIRVKSTQAVSPAFDARNCVTMRHYLYRIVLPKEQYLAQYKSTNGCNNHESIWPLPELDRAYLLTKTLDGTKLRDGCALLQRKADFASFMASPSKNDTRPIETIKSMEKVTLSPGQPLMDPTLEPAYSKLDIYNITFSSRSFLHNQIRRSVAVLVALAQGIITTEQVEYMFQEPRPGNVPPGVYLAPACGLYLFKVDYPNHVLLPDYRREEAVSDDVVRLANIKNRVKTMIALRKSNFKEENKTIDKLSVQLRRLEKLRDSLLKEAAHQPLEEGLPSKKCIDAEKENTNSAINEMKSDLLSNDLPTVDESKTETMTSGESDIMHKPERRLILDKIFSLLINRDEIDDEVSGLMEKLIKDNRMNKHSYDAAEMEAAVKEIIEGRRSDRERKVDYALSSKLYERPVRSKRTTELVASSEEEGEHLSAQRETSN